jgi:UDP-N-acetyl-D-glucosamine dehydrogenase
MPGFVMNELAMALDRRAQKGLNGARILVVGVAYKRNVDDTRESPALRLMELLEARGAAVDYYDPYVPVIPETRDHRTLTGRKSPEWDLEQFAGYDAALARGCKWSWTPAMLARGPASLATTSCALDPIELVR